MIASEEGVRALETAVLVVGTSSSSDRSVSSRPSMAVVSSMGASRCVALAIKSTMLCPGGEMNQFGGRDKLSEVRTGGKGKMDTEVASSRSSTSWWMEG